MTIMEAIKARHSVRSYTEKALPKEIIDALSAEIAACNKEGDLHIQLVHNEPEAFAGMMAHYGKFSGVQNYLAMVGKKSSDLEEKIGYYGERIALKAQMLGLNTCWVALTFSKGTVKKNITVNDDEKMVLVLSLGYGTTQGVQHKSRDFSAVSEVKGEMPDWFKAGVEAALLAPTAMNQQRFQFELDGETVTLKNRGGFYTKIDLGIVKYHFETASGHTVA